MRIVHLCTTDTMGGASRGAYWLHRALIAAGADSLMLVDRKYSDDATVIEASAGPRRVTRALRARLDGLPLARYRKTAESYWSIGWVPHHIERALDALVPDIVHLHWITGGFVPIAALARIGRPLVWTLRDMWAFTGGCHYAGACDRYRVSCGNCPQLRSADADDLSRRVVRAKLKRWQGLDLTLVPISRWLADQARSSPLFADQPSVVIPNGIDVRRFRPVDRALAKCRFGFAPGRKLVLFGAVNALTDPRKGFGSFARSAALLAGSPVGADIEFAVFGANAPEGGAGPGVPPMRFLGAVTDDATLATLYSAADVMVTPSMQEAFGKTLIEAFACATPVVAYDSGGPADIVDHGDNGYLARPFDPASLADGIAWCFAEADRAAALGRAGRAKAEAVYDISAVADRYVRLYAERLEGARAAA